MSGDAAGDDQRQQRDTGAERRHHDRRQPLARAAKNEPDPKRLVFDLGEMTKVLEQQDAIACRDTEDGDDADQRSERDHAIADERREHRTDQRRGQREKDQRSKPPIAQRRLQHQEDCEHDE